MPPKKKGGGSNSIKDEGQEKARVIQIFNQLDQEKINALSKRVDEAVSERMELQKKLDKGEKDTNEFVNHFQKELEKKDVLIGTQRNALKEAETKLDQTVVALTESYEEKIKKLEEDSKKAEDALVKRNTKLELQLQKLVDFQESKKLMEEQIKHMEAEAEEVARKHKVDLADLERHFLMDKAKTQASFEDRINNLRAEEEMRLEAGRDAETKRIIKENKRVKDELRYQQEITDELNADKRRTVDANKRFGRELALLEDKEVEYARQGKAKTKEIHLLKERNAELEAHISELKKSLQNESESNARVHKREMAEGAKEANQLRQLIILKNKELAMLKTHAQTILDQRTEVEQFFIDALEQCKSAINAQRDEEYRRSLAQYRQQMKNATKSEMGSFYKKRNTLTNEGNIFDKTELRAMSASGETCDTGGVGGDALGRTLASAFAPPQGGPAYVGTPLTSTPPSAGGHNIPVRSLNNTAHRGEGGEDTKYNQDGTVIFPSIRPGIAQRNPLDGTVTNQSLVAAGVGLNSSSLPVGVPPQKVQLSDLGWADRERVLRMLFAKINGVQGSVKKMPEHSLS